MGDSKRSNTPSGVDKLEDPIYLMPAKKELVCNFLKEMTGITFKFVKEPDPKHKEVILEKLVSDYVTHDKYFPEAGTYNIVELHSAHLLRYELVKRDLKPMFDSKDNKEPGKTEFRYEIPQCNIVQIEICNNSKEQKDEIFAAAVLTRKQVEASRRESAEQVRTQFKLNRD